MKKIVYLFKNENVNFNFINYPNCNKIDFMF